MIITRTLDESGCLQIYGKLLKNQWLWTWTGGRKSQGKDRECIVSTNIKAIMGKDRMTLVDVMAVVKECRQLLGMRLANIYSLSNKAFIFKLASPGAKKFLLMESGNRLHLTQYARDKDGMPNSFATKLRKHIRTKRLEMVRQLGLDRIIILTFGSGETSFHVILEMFSGGNIILTDHTFTILNTLRVFTYDKTKEGDQKTEGNDSKEKEKEKDSSTESTKAVQKSGHDNAHNFTGRRVAVGEVPT